MLAGLHENYLTVGYPDPSLSRTAEAAEWLSIHQVRTHAQYSQGHFALMRYAEFSILGVQHSCSVAHTKDQIRFPKAATEQRTKQRERTQMLASWRAGMPAKIGRCYNSATLVTDLVSPLLSLLCPPFRSTSSHILNTEEKQMLTSMVDTMLSFGLCLKHSNQGDAGHSLVLDPPLPLLLPRDSATDGPQAHDAAAELAAQLPNHIRQLLAAELQRESLRRHYGAPAAPSASKPVSGAAASQPMQPLSAAAAAKSVKAPVAAPVGPAPVTRDMFGRPVGDSSRKRILGSHGSAAPGSAGAAVRYKFQEGVTNAVRRTVRIQDLL
jgi:chromosome transmission fidelity protein 18